MSWKALSPRWQRIFSLLAVVLVLAGIWYLRQPKAYRLIRQFPLTIHASIPASVQYTGAGLLVRTTPDRFTLYDWEGRRRWTIVADQPDLTGWSKLRPRNYDIMLHGASRPLATVLRVGSVSVVASPNGRYQTTAVVKRQSLLVRCWRDGRASGTPISLPITPAVVLDYAGRSQPDLSIRTMDSGQAFIAVSGRLFLIRDGRILAQGKGGKYPLPRISADGQLLSTPTAWAGPICYTIAVHGSKIALTKLSPVIYPYSVFGFDQIPTCQTSGLLAGGAILNSNGDVLAKGRVIQQVNTKNFLPVFSTPNGRYLLEYQQPGALTVHTVGSRRTWQVTPLGAYGGGVVTMDGRHLLQIPGHYQSYRFPPGMAQLLNRFPTWKERVLLSAPRALYLYEYPGRLRAQLRLRTASYSYRGGLTGQFWQDYSLEGTYPSPDGRTLVLLGRKRNSSNTSAIQALVFRW